MGFKFKRVAIAPNPRKEWAYLVTRQLHGFLHARGISVTSVRSSADLLIAVGGDGTILHEKEHCDLPIFAIGSKTSFVCQARRHDWRKKLATALARPRLQYRSMLSSWLNGKRLEDALNDVFVRNWDHRVLDFDVRVDGIRAKFMADGVIFSTPTGSSAYAYSAGGPQLKPTAHKYEVIALAPYRRLFKPLIVADGTTSRLVVTTKRQGFAVIDGQFSHKLKIGRNILVVKKAKRTVPLLY